MHPDEQFALVSFDVACHTSYARRVQYNGGKHNMIERHGMGEFWRAYLAGVPARRFVDGCCGSGAVSAFVGRERPDLALVCNDAHPAAVALLRGVSQEGWLPPPTLTEERYVELREAARCGEVSAEIGFAGFGASFGGKYFGGFARGTGRDYAAETARALLRDARALTRADFRSLDFEVLPGAVGVCPGDVWYFDKPYEGTTGYAGTPRFDHPRFWAFATALSEIVPVLVSEFAAPPGWRPIWSVERRQDARTREGVVSRVDQVFTH